MYVCVYLFVCYKKGSISFEPNIAKFTQKIDGCTGWVINFIRLKMVQNWLKILENVLGRYGILQFVDRRLAGARA